MILTSYSERDAQSLPRLRLNEMSTAASLAWKLMPEEKRRSTVSAARDELIHKQEVKATARHTVAIEAFHDVRATLAHVSLEVCSSYLIIFISY